MRARDLLVLGGIALVVAGLAALRRVREPAAPAPAAAEPAPAALPSVLDFGRDT